MAVDKLVDSTQLDADLTSVANAIRIKGGTSGQMAFPAGFVSAVQAIPTGITPTGTKSISITENGTTTEDVTNYASAEITVNVQGGGTEEAPLNDVNFIDYDGTILYSYSAAEFAALSEMPANPTHSGLTAQGWNWTLAEAKAKVAECGKCIIGQMYTTSDGKSRIYCSFDELFLSPWLGIAPNGTVVVDWGDNSATDTLTGTSLTTAKYVQHTYATPGDYCITLEVTSGSFEFIGTNQGSSVLSIDKGNTNRKFYASYVKKVEIGANANLGSYAFFNCTQLEEVTFPHGQTSMPKSCFDLNRLLKSITIPSSVTSIGDAAISLGTQRFISFPPNISSYQTSNFNTFFVNLRAIVFPDSTTMNNAHTFQNCFNLRFAVVSPNAKTLNTNLFKSCYALESFTVPSGVTSIGGSAFDDCWTLREIHFKPTTPPTCGSSVWTNVPTTCKIYVPTGSLSAYTSATNYPSSSTYTYVEE